MGKEELYKIISNHRNDPDFVHFLVEQARIFLSLHISITQEREIHSHKRSPSNIVDTNSHNSYSSKRSSLKGKDGDWISALKEKSSSTRSHRSRTPSPTSIHSDKFEFNSIDILPCKRSLSPRTSERDSHRKRNLSPRDSHKRERNSFQKRSLSPRVDSNKGFQSNDKFEFNVTDIDSTSQKSHSPIKSSSFRPYQTSNYSGSISSAKNSFEFVVEDVQPIKDDSKTRDLIVQRSFIKNDRRVLQKKSTNIQDDVISSKPNNKEATNSSNPDQAKAFMQQLFGDSRQNEISTNSPEQGEITDDHNYQIPLESNKSFLRLRNYFGQ